MKRMSCLNNWKKYVVESWCAKWALMISRRLNGPLWHLTNKLPSLNYMYKSNLRSRCKFVGNRMMIYNTKFCEIRPESIIGNRWCSIQGMSWFWFQHNVGSDSSKNLSYSGIDSDFPELECCTYWFVYEVVQWSEEKTS